jgi:hypothetical protein
MKALCGVPAAIPPRLDALAHILFDSKEERMIMKTIRARVCDDRHLELEEDLGQPEGAMLIIHIETSSEMDDYGRRLRAYYASCSEEALQEESDIAESLMPMDAPIDTDDMKW